MSAIESFNVYGLEIEIHHDQDAESPREWDNFGRIWTFQRSYNSPDETPAKEPRAALEYLACELYGNALDCDRLDDSALMALIQRRAVVLPVFVYEHGNIAYSCGAFSCPWDSGQCGWTFATKAEILENWGGKYLTPAKRAKAEKALRGEVETYSQYANGEVYGYVLKDENGDELDSLWGCFGFEYVQEEARAAAKAERERLDAEAAAATRTALLARFARLKAFIRARVPLQVRADALENL
jgi:hypothetical protein